MDLEKLTKLVALMKANGITHAKIGDIELRMDPNADMQRETMRRLQEKLDAEPKTTRDPIDVYTDQMV